MTWTIEYPYGDVEQFVLKLPIGLSAKYFHLTDLMLEFGTNLGLPHTKPMSNGLFELGLRGRRELPGCFTALKWASA